MKNNSLQYFYWYIFVGLSNIGYTIPYSRVKAEGGDFFSHTDAKKTLPDLDPSPSDRLIAEHGNTLDNETIVHSDQGCHYTSYAFIQKLKDAEFVQSMSRRGNCWDNSPQESFFGHMKDEISDLIAICITFEDVVARIDDWMDYYNNDRGQWDLLKLAPMEYYVYIQTGIYPLPVYQKPTSRGSAPDPEV